MTLINAFRSSLLSIIVSKISFISSKTSLALSPLSCVTPNASAIILRIPLKVSHTAEPIIVAILPRFFSNSAISSLLSCKNLPTVVPKFSTHLVVVLIIPVKLALPSSVIILLILVTTAASKFPIAPSNVAVLAAASLAALVIPNWLIALLNSLALICPFSIASRKLPV